MADESLSIFSPDAGARASTSSLLLGQVMFLVAVAIGFLAAGTYIGRDLSFRTAEICEFAAIGMILVQSFGGRALRTGALGMTWLYGLALLLGLGLAPVIANYAAYNHDVLYRAAGGTALTVVGMGSFGFLTSRDLRRWVRPVFFFLLIAIAAAWVLLLVGAGSNVGIELAIYLGSAAYLAIYFQFIRRSATEADAIWIATGVFITIVNIFVTLLSLLGNNR